MAAAPDLDWHPFRCDVVPNRDVVHLQPVGELELATVDEVERPLSELLDAGFRKLVLDLAGVTFIDSAGMRMVLIAREAASRVGGSLTVLPGPPPVQRSFELTGLSGLVFSQA
jgi:anti-sigma B factor antagonist